jgi:dTDP-glucose pyrophosphorylase
LEKLLVTEHISIRDALAIMSEEGEKSLVVVDPGKRVVGTLSDGDVRRAILAGKELTGPIDGIFFNSPTCLEQGQYLLEQVRELFLKSRFDVIPIIDAAGVVKEVLTWANFFGEGEIPESRRVRQPVVIMSGGKGTRLEPFTKILPKPLLPVNEKPIIEHIIDRFVSSGTDVIFLTVNYKSRVLKAFFEELDPPYDINFIQETQPLGTAGGLKYLENIISETFFVTNCDVIINANYADLVSFHRERANSITLVACAKNFSIPYGTCVLNNDGDLDKIEEKPEYELLVNTGLYVLEPSILQYLGEGEFCHMTELIERAKNAGERVGVYPIGEKGWIDVGEWPEYKKAIASMLI